MHPQRDSSAFFVKQIFPERPTELLAHSVRGVRVRLQGELCCHAIATIWPRFYKDNPHFWVSARGYLLHFSRLVCLSTQNWGNSQKKAKLHSSAGLKTQRKQTAASSCEMFAETLISFLWSRRKTKRGQDSVFNPLDPPRSKMNVCLGLGGGSGERERDGSANKWKNIDAGSVYTLLCLWLLSLYQSNCDHRPNTRSDLANRARRGSEMVSRVWSGCAFLFAFGSRI